MTRCRSLALAVLTLAIVAAASTSAWAQGTFYREVEKDGRIYVFNIPAQFTAFDKSGEMGVSITKLGYGPNGETMVFDSVEAIHLYNFKHNRPGDAAKLAEDPPKPPIMTIAWRDGKTTITTNFAQMALSNRVQFRYTREMPDKDITTLPNGVPISGTAQPLDKGKSRDSFRVRRAKMKLEGWFWKPEFTYEFQMNFADTASSLEDAQLTWDFSKNKTAQIKIGQYKVPFGRQELTSSGSQQFVDRSIVSAEFNRQRDIGVSLQGLLMKGKLDYRVGAFNGNQRNKALNDNTQFQYNGRLVFQPWGDHKYSESDFDTLPGGKPLLAIGVQAEMNDLRSTTTAVDQKRTVFGPDLAFKYKGFSFFGDYYMRELEPEATATGPAVKFNSDGYQVQAGMFLYKRRWEVAVRYATWDPSDAVADNDRSEMGVAVNFFENKHALKVQGDFRILENKATKAKDNELRIQTQWIF
jgi:phosphate-selective porin OprO and OprP